MNTELTPLINAWEQTARSVVELCAGLPDADWNRPTECPGWSVRDCVSHIIGMEREAMGEPQPWHQLPRDLLHVRTEIQRHMEVPVDIRRCHTPPEMIAELSEVIDRAAVAVRNDGRGADEEMDTPFGMRRPRRTVLAMRAFDLWAHEQDIRRAVGRPGNLDGAAAELSRDWILAAMPRVVAREAAAPAGSTVLFDVSGPIAFSRVVAVDADRRGALSGEVPEQPTVSLGMDSETFVRLACGRVKPDAVEVKVEGSEPLARRILTAMTITP